MQFGVKIPVTGPMATPERIVLAATEAEKLGYSTLNVNDHIHKPFERHGSYPVGQGSVSEPGNTADPNHFETVTTFAYLAALTKRIGLLWAVLPLPLRDPVILAKELATLDALSGGRCILGIGVSNVTDKAEYAALQKPFLPYEQRWEQADEYVTAMKKIWTEPRASFHGKYVSFEDLTIYPKPHRPIPIWVGTRTLAGPRDRGPIRFSLKHADGWVYGHFAPPSEIAAMREAFQRSAQEVGKDISEFRLCVTKKISLAKTREEARRQIEWVLADTGMYRFAGYMWNLRESALQETVQKAFVGTPADILKNIEDYVAAGVNGLDIWFVHPRFDGFMEQMKQFADEVMPSFT